jgi:GNAT superfamily N-acetyltransferase
LTLGDCTLIPYDSIAISTCRPFICTNNDLNEFFSKDSIHYSDQLLGKTYCFTLKTDPQFVVVAFTVANDSIKTTHLPNSRKKMVQELIPRVKEMRSYPAVLIGRFGVTKEISGGGIGSEAIDFIKAWFINPKNKTGCRYVVVDAYNEDIPINFYKKNGFKFLFSTEEQEREYLKLPGSEKLKTRLMIFDLIILKS